MVDRNDIAFLVFILVLVGSVLVLQFMIDDANPNTSQGVYRFVDDSICPCSSGMMVFSEECNKETDRLLDLGYKEVMYCEKSRRGEQT